MHSYKEGICSGCGETKLIVFKSGKLCFTCNRNRLFARYQKRAEKRPKFSKKAVKQMANDLDTYWKVYESKPKICEECGVPLPIVEKSQIGKIRWIFSHILSKGAYPKLRHELSNFNALCFLCHQKWENRVTQKEMKIWKKNKPVIIKLLKLDLL